MCHTATLQHAAGPNNTLCLKCVRIDSTYDVWRQDYPGRCHQKTELVMEMFIHSETQIQGYLK